MGALQPKVDLFVRFADFLLTPDPLKTKQDPTDEDFDPMPLN
jgi:hypothetical protein